MPVLAATGIKREIPGGRTKRPGADVIGGRGHGTGSRRRANTISRGDVLFINPAPVNGACGVDWRVET